MGESDKKKVYWEGMFWDGFPPEMVGAVHLEKCVADGCPILNIMLETTRKRLTQANRPPADYWVTILDIVATDPPSSSKMQMPPVKSRVIRCWHKNVFLGARESAKGNPAALNIDMLFEHTDGQFICEQTWEETTEKYKEEEEEEEETILQ